MKACPSIGRLQKRLGGRTRVDVQLLRPLKGYVGTEVYLSNALRANFLDRIRATVT